MSDIDFDKTFADMADQVAVMNRECNRLQAALDRAEADKAAAVEVMTKVANAYYDGGDRAIGVGIRIAIAAAICAQVKP